MKEGYGRKTAWPMQGDAERSTNVMSDVSLILDIYWVAHEHLLSMDKKKKRSRKLHNKMGQKMRRILNPPTPCSSNTVNSKCPYHRRD